MEINSIKKVIDLNFRKTNITTTTFDLSYELKIVKKIAGEIFKYEYKFDALTEPAVLTLIRYLNQDSTLENEKFSLYKGILLVGGIGCGKTDLMELMRNYAVSRKTAVKFRTFSAETIASDYGAKGNVGLNFYFTNPSVNEFGIGKKEPFALCIDDLGLENPDVKHFGDTEDVISKLLYKRYELFKAGILTHATTNLDIPNLAERYDNRIFSRISEMFNILILTGNDRRKESKYKKLCS